MSQSTGAALRRLSQSHVRLAVRQVTEQAAALLSGSGHPDAALLAACADYGRIRAEIDRASRPRARAGDPGGLKVATLLAAGRVPLDAAVTAVATTPDGHCARAAMFLAWDEGELIARARSEAILEDRLLAALLVDLVAG